MSLSESAYCDRCGIDVEAPAADPGPDWRWVLWVCRGDGEHSWVKRRVTPLIPGLQDAPGGPGRDR